MNRDRWQQIDRIFEAALDIEPSSRRAFLDLQCGTDHSLRVDVEKLLAAHEKAGAFIETAPLDEAAELLLSSSSESLSGRSLLHYSVLNRIGVGGMGHVYLAHDTKLGRRVALKLLPATATADKTTIRRFQQEACAASSLNHPNILTIYEVGYQDDQHFIVTEFIEGETLRDLLRRGKLSIPDALNYAIQIGNALAAAHKAGIVHRDVKPENVMLRPDGLVKVLDFGLAKLSERPAASLSPATSASGGLTQAGIVMGTINYMSPEQARGTNVDVRTDVFSLGVVLYEMLAGARPFTGETPTDVLVALLEKDPTPLHTHLADAPPSLERAIARALSKERSLRPENAGSFVEELNRLKRELDAAGSGKRVACASCGGFNPASFGFCGTCGAALTKNCPKCGRAISYSESACEACSPNEDSFRTVAEVRGAAQSTQAFGSQAPERRTATILYAHLSGCSAIVEELDQNDADKLLSWVKSSVTESIVSHGGVVDRCSGEELVALFGVPTAFEDDYLRAVHAGLALRDVLSHLNTEVQRKLGRALLLCAGVSSGPVVTRVSGDGTLNVSGETYQVAGRLAAHADAGEILLSPETQRLVAPYFSLEQRADVSLGPSAPPVPIFKVLGESGVQTRLQAAEVCGFTPHTGREKELESLESALASTISGEGQLVTVVGDAGVGKSRLLVEFRRMVEQDQVSVLTGRCQSHRLNVAYLPFIEVLTELLELRQQASPDVLLRKAITGIRAVNRELEPYIPVYLHLLSIQSSEYVLPGDLKGDDLRIAIQEALSAIITLSANRRATVVLLEDWHWADEGSDEALRRLVALVTACPLMIIVTCRPERTFDWGYSGARRDIHLGPLDESAAASIASSLLGARRLPQGLGPLLHRRTGGNPFFVEEMTKALLESGLIRLDEGEITLQGSLAELQLPDTIQAVIRTRLDRVDSAAQHVLRHASILGREFGMRVLERMLDGGPLVTRSMETLNRHGLIQQLRVLPEPVSRFRHALMQEVVYDSLLLHQRKALHEAAGHAIEDVYAGRLEEQLELLAHHYNRAENWVKAVDFGIQSADKASRLSRFAEALAMLERAQEWVAHLADGYNSSRKLITVLLKQERICETLGLREQQEAIIDRLLSLTDEKSEPAMRAEVLLRQGEFCTLKGELKQAESALIRSLSIYREISDAIGERVALRTIGFLRWHEARYDEAVESNKTALSIDLALNDQDGYATDLNNVASILRSQGRPEQALSYLRQAYDIANQNGSPFGLVYNLTVTATVYRDLGDFEKAKSFYKRGLEISTQHKMHVHQITPNHSLASLSWSLGETEDALAYSREVVAMTRDLGMRRELTQALSWLSQRLLELNRTEEALPYLTEAAEVCAQIGDPEEEARALTGLAYVRENSGIDGAEKLATWERLRSLRTEQGNTAAQVEALEGMSRVARTDLQNPALALEYLRQALLLVTQNEDSPKQGELLNTIGIVEWSRENFSAALEQYQKAHRIFKAAGDGVHTGLMLNSIGVTLTKLGRSQEATTRLYEALEVHRQSGQRLLEGHALAALGDIFRDSGAMERAEESYRESLLIRKEIGDRKGEGWMLKSLSRLALSQSREEEAQALLEEARKIAEEVNDARLKDECNKRLA